MTPEVPYRPDATLLGEHRRMRPNVEAEPPHLLKPVGADLEPGYHPPALMVLCLNTTQARRHKHGEVSSAQIERAEQRLACAAPGQLRVVVVHQPVAITQFDDEANLLRWGDRLAPRGQGRAEPGDHDDAARAFVCRSTTDLPAERADVR